MVPLFSPELRTNRNSSFNKQILNAVMSDAVLVVWGNKMQKQKNLAILVEHTRKRGTNDYKIQQNMLINGHELNRLLAF